MVEPSLLTVAVMVSLRSTPFFTLSQVAVPALASFGLSLISSSTCRRCLKKWRLTRETISWLRSNRCGWQSTVVVAFCWTVSLPEGAAAGAVMSASDWESASLS